MAIETPTDLAQYTPVNTQGMSATVQPTPATICRAIVPRGSAVAASFPTRVRIITNQRQRDVYVTHYTPRIEKLRHVQFDGGNVQLAVQTPGGCKRTIPKKNKKKRASMIASPDKSMVTWALPLAVL
jgi:hypothetical protein